MCRRRAKKDKEIDGKLNITIYLTKKRTILIGIFKKVCDDILNLFDYHGDDNDKE